MSNRRNKKKTKARYEMGAHSRLLQCPGPAVTADVLLIFLLEFLFVGFPPLIPFIDFLVVKGLFRELL